MKSRLTRAREMAGLSLAQAARLLGMTVAGSAVPGVATLRQVEAGWDDENHGPDSPPDDAWRFADLYGVSIAYLRGDDLVLRPETEALLRSVESTDDRAKLTELLIATQGVPR